MLVRRAADALCSDPAVDGLGEGGIFHKARRLARVVVELLALSRGLDAAIVHLEDNGVRAVVDDRLYVYPGVHTKLQGHLQSLDPRPFRKFQELFDRPRLEGGEPCPGRVITALGVEHVTSCLDTGEPDSVVGQPVDTDVVEEFDQLVFRHIGQCIRDAVYHLKAKGLRQAVHLDVVTLLADFAEDVERLGHAKLVLCLHEPHRVVDYDPMQGVDNEAGQILLAEILGPHGVSQLRRHDHLPLKVIGNRFLTFFG